MTGWVSTNKDDTYIAPAGLGGKWNCSLHRDVAWRWAVTTEELTSPNPVWRSQDRAPWKFEPTPFVDGVRLAFVNCTFRHAPLPLPLDPRDEQIRVNDRWDQVTQARIWMSEPHIELSDDRLIADPLLLDSGRHVWVKAATEALPEGKPEPLAVGSMLEPAVPGVLDVLAPGVFHRGVHFSETNAAKQFRPVGMSPL